MQGAKRFLYQCLGILSSRQGRGVSRCNGNCQSWSWRFWIQVHNQPLMVGVGVEHIWGSGSGIMVPTWRGGTWAGWLRDCPEVEEWLSGCQVVQGFHMVWGICQRAFWRVVSYRIIEPWWMRGFQSWILELEIIWNQLELDINIGLQQCASRVADVACWGLWQSHMDVLSQGCTQGELWGLDGNTCWKRRV